MNYLKKTSIYILFLAFAYTPLNSKSIPGSFADLAEKLMPSIGTNLIGKAYTATSNSVDNKKLVDINKTIREHGVETIGAKLRGYMTDMKAIVATA
jgi:hypothetical protein